MRKKVSRIGWLILGTLFILTFFSSIRIMAIYYYHMQATKGNLDLAMVIMDKAHEFNLTSYVTGWLHGWVVLIMTLIVIDR